MHVLTDRAVRVLVGMSIPSAAQLAHVSIDTVKRHERGVQIRSPEKAGRLATYYEWCRLMLGWSASALRCDAYDGEDEGTIPPPPHDSGERVSLPRPAGLPTVDEASPPTQPSTRAA